MRLGPFIFFDSFLFFLDPQIYSFFDSFYYFLIPGPFKGVSY